MKEEYRDEIKQIIDGITDERELYLILLYARCAAGYA